ncbi:type II toxin-antitoxin system VapB family antitoxin [Streptosporangium sp. 'caverna']|uniref:type II toxin-antitoxin system VapB family antitoxin n=1 Tax=Streptosporangium sp. 'caverna' TaxID=2202249 RepID=UPI000D7DCA55|nr:type II toxin-antitoxin system VapB family antitoxin [Streptosporangium sp. 'caverna']AWS40034.1 antitoxin VapB6 [Streptosporangium sp. 'caverna']
MSVTRIDLDDGILAEAMRMPDTTVEEDAVSIVLREYVARVKRIEALEALSARAARGEFDDAEKTAKARWAITIEVRQRDIGVP